MLYQPTVTLDHTPPDAFLDPGYYATQRKKDSSTTPVPRPSKFGEVIHLDIVFGPEVSIGNIHYGLLCVDRFSRMTYMYPLQNLTGDIQKQLESFFCTLRYGSKKNCFWLQFETCGWSSTQVSQQSLGPCECSAVILSR